MNIPPLRQAQRTAIQREFPATAEDWIAGYPALVQRCVDRWQLKLTDQIRGGLPINVIFFGEDPDGREVVLKIGHPHPEQVTEMIALREYRGRLAPALLDCDRDLGATLMERVRPGRTFREASPGSRRSDMRLDIFAQLGRPCDAVDGLPRYGEWVDRAFSRFREQFDGDHPFRQHIDRARALFVDIEDEAWLLHGDLHHENLLADEHRGWIAIDPKGVIGPRVMECGRFLHNFLDDEIERDTLTERAAIVRRRCDVLADVMRVSAEQLVVAAYIDAVLGTCWTLNDGNEHPAREVRAILPLL